MRVTLVCHGATAATRRGAFPLDEPLEARSAERAAASPVAPGARELCLTSPALRARATATAMGLAAAIDPALRDLDAGRWAGSSLAEIEALEPDALAAWLSHPDAAPHGGETLAALLARTAAWLDGLAPDATGIVSVTHPAIIRAAIVHALGAPPGAFWRIDVPPLAIVRLAGEPGRWTLRTGPR